MATSSYTGPNGTTYYYNTKGRDNDAQASIAAMTNQANIDIAKWTTETQNQQNIDFWNMQNEYNTPSAQIQRLKDAQLNPSFYGLEGNGNAAQLQAASNLPTMESPNYFENNDINRILDSAKVATDSIQKALNYYNDTNRLEADINESKLRQEGLGIENAYKGLQLDDEMSKHGWAIYRDRTNANFVDPNSDQPKIHADNVVKTHNKEMEARQDVAKKTRLETSILEAGTPYLSQLPEKQLAKAAKELMTMDKQMENLDYQNAHEKWDKELRDLGLDPNMSWSTQLFYMAMHDKNSYTKVLSAMIEAIGATGKNLIGSLVNHSPKLQVQP